MKNIMIVDDSVFMRNLIKKILRDNNHRVVAEAKNGIQALKKYSDCNPDIVLLDITMPDMNGLETLKEILRIDPKANIIMLSSLGTNYHVTDSLKIGAKDFIVKPNFENLIPIIAKIS